MRPTSTSTARADRHARYERRARSLTSQFASCLAAVHAGAFSPAAGLVKPASAFKESPRFTPVVKEVTRTPTINMGFEGRTELGEKDSKGDLIWMTLLLAATAYAAYLIPN